jgi:DNA-binding transcriptional ArsR family regulator
VADLNWKALATASMHPLALRILERAAAEPDERFAPTELALELDEKLGNVSYHMRALVAAGLLKPAGTKTVRGALKHYYVIAEGALR